MTSLTNTAATGSRARWVRRLALVGAAGLAAAALAQPAVARPTLATGVTDPTLTLELGATPVTVMEPAIQGDDANDTVDINNEVSPSHETPEGCVQDLGCALVPIKLDIPAAKFANNQFLLSVTIAWATGPAETGLPAGEYVYGDELENLIYDNPRAMDDQMHPTYTSAAFLEPSQLTDPSPPSGNIDLVVVNDQGVNSGFTVTANVIDNAPQASYYPPGVTQFSTYGKGTNTTAVQVPKKGTSNGSTTSQNAPKPTVRTKHTVVTEPPPVGTTIVPVTTVPQAQPVVNAPVGTTTVPAVAAPIVDADATKVTVGKQLAGTVDPALVQLASDTGPASLLGLKDEAITGNKVATAAATGSAKHSWLVVLSLLIPALAVIGWMFFLARKRRAQVDTRSLGTVRTA